jgi:hypothetical protein
MNSFLLTPSWSLYKQLNSYYTSKLPRYHHASIVATQTESNDSLSKIILFGSPPTTRFDRPDDYIFNISNLGCQQRI